MLATALATHHIAKLQDAYMLEETWKAVCFSASRRSFWDFPQLPMTIFLFERTYRFNSDLHHCNFFPAASSTRLPVGDLTLQPLASNSTTGVVHVQFENSGSPDVEYIVKYCSRSGCDNTTFAENEGLIAIECTGPTEVNVSVYTVNQCGQMSTAREGRTELKCELQGM